MVRQVGDHLGQRFILGTQQFSDLGSKCRKRIRQPWVQSVCHHSSVHVAVLRAGSWRVETLMGLRMRQSEGVLKVVQERHRDVPLTRLHQNGPATPTAVVGTTWNALRT
ncbi:hypothetical protein AFM16_05140 [Streptomyces antibioticus]|uniref:Uncharacterized protein n=1 Tax=Streptomyces antibioticus TaxID=1890 RepID=A0ABX3LQC2_STRAT|nr:hypothetical protein AFM16_05140 [Streptomyces antibioticus]